MAHAKNFLFSDDEQLFAAYCKALAHPARRRIIEALRHGEVRTVQEIIRDIPLSTSTMYSHLVRLERIQLIQVYHSENCDAGLSIRKEVWEEMLALMADFGRFEK